MAITVAAVAATTVAQITTTAADAAVAQLQAFAKKMQAKSPHQAMGAFLYVVFCYLQ